MTTTRTFAGLAVSALALSIASMASAQTPYNQSQPQTQPQEQGVQQDRIGAILGALFGDRLGVSTSLESEWSRGRRPLANQRSQFESRIVADVRSGALSNSSADRLRRDYDDLVQLEARYTADGRVTTQERADLVARYREFSQRVEAGGGGGYGDQGSDVAGGRAEFEARVDAAVRARRLTRTEATRLKRDYQDLIQVEAGYLRDGRLTSQERNDLDSRLDALDARVGDVGTGGGGYQDNRTRLSNIERALASGSGLSRAEIDDIRVEHGDLVRLEAAYSRTQPSSDDRAYLERRIGELETRARVRR